MLKKIISVIVIILLIPFGFVAFQLSPTSLSGEKIRFVIPLETKQEDIINNLKSQNFIRNKDFFNLILGLLGFPGTIEPGSYMLAKNMTAFSVADTLLHHPYQKWIVLVPGLRIEQVAERLTKKFDWNENETKEFLQNGKEGYMYPDTYLLNTDYTPVDVAKRLIANFNDKFDAQIQNDLLKADIRNDTAVKIASLIERESGGDDDKALISGIIWNRLNIGMKLQIDASIQYIIGAPKDWWPLVIPSKMQINSPYNSYLYKGLPPTPICNPSIQSIRAAAYPTDTDCFFYLHDRGKNIHCAKTYEEHLQNIEIYLK